MNSTHKMIRVEREEKKLGVIDLNERRGRRQASNEERGGAKEGAWRKGEEGEIKVIYLNGRRGRRQAEVALQIGSEKRADVVVFAEALEEAERRPQHGTYNLVANSKYLSLYTRKGRYIRVELKDRGAYALIGGQVAAAYLPPQLNNYDVRTMLNKMARGHTIMGDLNCCGGSKRRVLEEFIELGEWADIGKEEHTHQWGNHKCRIDRVLTKGGGRLWFFEEGWECKSDHTIIAVQAVTEAEKVIRTETDWDKVRQWLDAQEEKPDDKARWECVGDPYRQAKQVMGKRSQGMRKKQEVVEERMETIEKESEEM